MICIWYHIIFMNLRMARQRTERRNMNSRNSSRSSISGRRVLINNFSQRTNTLIEPLDDEATMFDMPGVSSILKRVHFGKIFTVASIIDHNSGYLLFVDDARKKTIACCDLPHCHIFFVRKKTSSRGMLIQSRDLFRPGILLGQTRHDRDSLKSCNICKASHTFTKARTFVRCPKILCLIDGSFTTTCGY